ncbi:MAG: RNA 2',3'-cyclic phosphodiesterase [Candidatus Marsarchaeota archaeon]|nr:RNA 2',3'-cyclic phosphodiesterase [Candidatus Marsarchaeota archaeon]
MCRNDPMADSMRAFVAAEIDQVARKRIEALISEMDCSAIRPVREDQIHVTLMFMGQLGDAAAKAISDAISQLDEEPFGVSVNGIGTFSGSGIRIIYAKITDGYDELLRIRSSLKESADRIGIKADGREFAAHATIARVKNPSDDDIDYIRGFIASHSEDALGDFTCSEIKLKRSVLGEKGPAYTDIFVKRLGR